MCNKDRFNQDRSSETSVVVSADQMAGSIKHVTEGAVGSKRDIWLEKQPKRSKTKLGSPLWNHRPTKNHPINESNPLFLNHWTNLGLSTVRDAFPIQI
jgi:hypothetical protein